MSRIAGILFDVGGVVVDSPLHAIARYERDHGLPPNAVTRAVAATGEAGAWSRLERGELELDAFFPLFETDCRGCGVEVDGRRLMTCIGEARTPRPAMLEAIRRLRAHGLRVGALTNNWRSATVSSAPRAPGALRLRTSTDPRRLREHFDVFVESSVVGLRKPDPWSMSKTVNIHEAKTHFSRLVERAARGEEIIITRGGHPIARLGPLARPKKRLRPGLLKGRIRIGPDFDAPLPEDLVRLFEGR